jgi:hypothetical protein
MQRDSPCRESRPVPFYENASIWKAVEAGVIVSADIDENMCFNPPVRAEKKLAFQMQRKPVLPRSPSYARLPTRLPPIESVHVRLLAAELRSAEAEIAALRKHVNTQNRVIDGLCRLRVAK